MGKNISGKELGKGLGQRKDGLYYARYKDCNDKWQERCFKRLPEVKPMHCWEQLKLTIRKTMEFRYKQQNWRAGPPKTKRSYRTIPLTDGAYHILQELYLGRLYRKEAPELQRCLTYLDRKTGAEKPFVCTRFAIHTPPAQLRVACRLSHCKDYLGTQV